MAEFLTFRLIHGRMLLIPPIFRRSRYLDHKPLSDLHKWQIEGFPFRLLKERGLMDEVERLTCEVA